WPRCVTATAAPTSPLSVKLRTNASRTFSNCGSQVPSTSTVIPAPYRFRAVQIDTLVDGLVFPEGPRWRDGTLWFSDIWDDRVARVSTDGNCVTVTRLEQPSGLG